jgi:hypothetical protein
LPNDPHDRDRATLLDRVQGLDQSIDRDDIERACRELLHQSRRRRCEDDIGLDIVPHRRSPFACRSGKPDPEV